MDGDARRWMQVRAGERRRRGRRDGLGSPEAERVPGPLEAAGIDTVDFGLFGAASFMTFHFGRAAPILVEWLPRIDETADRLRG